MIEFFELIQKERVRKYIQNKFKIFNERSSEGPQSPTLGFGQSISISIILWYIFFKNLIRCI